MNKKIIDFDHLKIIKEYIKQKISGKADKTDIPTSLPANGGNADTIDGKHAADFAASGHTHDDRYYTETEINTKLTEKADKSHSHSAASQSANGFMSAADKAKLDGIAANANNYTYTHPVSSGNKHIPSGGASGQILRWSADGTAVWGPDNNTVYANMTAASASAAGKSGLVPAPAAGAQAKYLRGDGTWQTPPDTNTTYSVVTQSSNGLMSAADKKKLDGIDGTESVKTLSCSSPSFTVTFTTVVENGFAVVKRIAWTAFTTTSTSHTFGTVRNQPVYKRYIQLPNSVYIVGVSKT